MKKINLLHSLFIFLLLGFAVCAMQSCGDYDDSYGGSSSNNRYDDDDDDDDDDSSGSSWKKDCRKCGGDGECPTCGGDGVVYEIGPGWIECPARCDDGVCPRCDGSGKED